MTGRFTAGTAARLLVACAACIDRSGSRCCNNLFVPMAGEHALALAERALTKHRAATVQHALRISAESSIQVPSVRQAGARAMRCARRVHTASIAHTSPGHTAPCVDMGKPVASEGSLSADGQDEQSGLQAGARQEFLARLHDCQRCVVLLCLGAMRLTQGAREEPNGDLK